MSNNRNKKKLTTRQLNKMLKLITGLVCVLLFALLAIKMCSSDYFIQFNNPPGKILTIYLAFMLSSLIWGVAYALLYVIIIKPKSLKEAIFYITNNLSKDAFTEIYYKFQNSSDDITVEIVKNEQCKFYAKLDEDQDDNIIIIAKNKSEEEVYRTVTKNPKYFLYHFSLTTN